MSWFKVDDQLAFNAKVMLAGNSAMGLWVRAGSWSSAQLTGGFIPAHMANAMANAMANPCDTDALVMAELWTEVDGGYQFHDWSDFQPDADAEKEKRKALTSARSQAGKAGAEARWGKTSDSKPHGKRNSKPMATQWQTDAPVPSRPDLLPNGSSGTRDEHGQTGTRIPATFTTTPQMIAWAMENTPNVDWRLSTQKFKSHHRSVAGRAQFKTDWVAAWELWLLSDQQKHNDRPQQFLTKSEKNLQAGAALMTRYADEEQLSIEGAL